MKPIEIQAERQVPFSAEAIWALIEPVENLPKWFHLADRAELVSGQGKGRIQRQFSTWGRRTAEIEQQVTDYEPPRLLAWKHTRELIDGKPATAFSVEVKVTVRLDPAPGGTRIRLQSHNVPANRLKRLVIILLAKPRIQRAFEQALENIARQVLA